MDGERAPATRSVTVVFMRAAVGPCVFTPPGGHGYFTTAASFLSSPTLWRDVNPPRAFCFAGSKPFMCKICNFATAQLGDARNHVKRHLGMREYKCDICG